MPLNSVDLPAPFGPTTAIRAPAADLAVEVMHRRVPVVAERHIAKIQCAGDRLWHRPSPHGPENRRP